MLPRCCCGVYVFVRSALPPPTGGHVIRIMLFVRVCNVVTLWSCLVIATWQVLKDELTLNRNCWAGIPDGSMQNATVFIIGQEPSLTGLTVGVYTPDPIAP